MAISLTWSISGDPVVSTEVVWRAVGHSGASGSSGAISSTSYTIPDLQELSVYNITVTVNKWSLWQLQSICYLFHRYIRL